MREIEFRGKCIEAIDFGKWLFGSLVVKESHAYISLREDADFLIEVDPETVGEYTGLKDKNGAMIFEGDIVRYGISEKKNYCVVYLETDAGFYMTDDIHKCPCDIRGNPLGGKNTYYIKVIGNIHDNPELLEAGDENNA